MSRASSRSPSASRRDDRSDTLVVDTLERRRWSRRQVPSLATATPTRSTSRPTRQLSRGVRHQSGRRDAKSTQFGCTIDTHRRRCSADELSSSSAALASAPEVIRANSNSRVLALLPPSYLRSERRAGSAVSWPNYWMSARGGAVEWTYGGTPMAADHGLRLWDATIRIRKQRIGPYRLGTQGTRRSFYRPNQTDSHRRHSRDIFIEATCLPVKAVGSPALRTEKSYHNVDSGSSRCSSRAQHRVPDSEQALG